MELSVHTDGGARGNPGPAACGFVLRIADTWQWVDAVLLGDQTNNTAEYQGLIHAAAAVSTYRDRIIACGVTKVVFHLDSELVVKQVQGVYRVKEPSLQVLHRQVGTTLAEMGIPYTVVHVRREHNKLADALVNAALDGNLDQLKQEYCYDRNGN
jgi:ribonuclease HI